jgi:hypothetical protein
MRAVLEAGIIHPGDAAIVGAIFTILFAFPLFWLFDTTNALVIGATVAVAISFARTGERPPPIAAATWKPSEAPV